MVSKANDKTTSEAQILAYRRLQDLQNNRRVSNNATRANQLDTTRKRMEKVKNVARQAKVKAQGDRLELSKRATAKGVALAELRQKGNSNNNNNRLKVGQNYSVKSLSEIRKRVDIGTEFRNAAKLKSPATQKTRPELLTESKLASRNNLAQKRKVEYERNSKPKATEKIAVKTHSKKVIEPMSAEELRTKKRSTRRSVRALSAEELRNIKRSKKR